MEQEMDENQFKVLLSKYKSNTATPDEIKAMFEFFKSHEADGCMHEDLQVEFDKIFHADIPQKNVAGVFRLRSLKRFAIAAAASIIIIFGLYYAFFSGIKSETKRGPLVAANESIRPGHSQAVLSMSNGKKIILDSAAVGQIAVLPGTVISIDTKGELIYDATKATPDQKIITNTVSTPTGGFFKVMLPDGSKVWLNSESELTFPSQFTGANRDVALKGEGFFEVSKNKEMPFQVALDHGEKITVLGTVFNVMTYANEPHQKITLLEGSIDLTAGDQNKILKPGQQAIVTGSAIALKSDVNIDHEIAWKNGLFDFIDDDLPTVMRQISRWYNVDILYSSTDPDSHFTGFMRKSSGIKDILKMLELAGDVRFSIVGKKIIVNEKTR